MSDQKDHKDGVQDASKRELLAKIGMGAAYIAPATLLLLSSKANAAS